MKLTAKFPGYEFIFHPHEPVAFTMPNSSEMVVRSTLTWKPITKLSRLKYAREIGFTPDTIVVSGMEGHIGVYELDDFSCRSIFKLKIQNDSWGFYVHAASNCAGLVAGYDGLIWVDYATKETDSRFRPTEELGFGPMTKFIHPALAADQFVTLCIYTVLVKDEPNRRSVVHLWSVNEDKPLKSFDVFSKPSPKEYVDCCRLGLDNTLIVSTNWGNRLVGINLDTGDRVFDNPKMTHGGMCNHVVYAALPKRRLIAVGSNGFIDFWNSNLSELVYQFDSGKREGYDGDLTVSPDEKYLACCVNGKMHVYELPESLQGK